MAEISGIEQQGEQGNKQEVEQGISRRGFLSGLTAVGAIALTGGLGACAPETGGTEAPSEPEDAPATSAPTDIAETLEADIIIVGAGISGLSAAVQASQDGNKVIVLEKGGKVGGNGLGTEGVFAVNSDLQQQQGIHIDPVDIAAKELEQAQYRADGSLWIDLINNSAENIAWLQSNGVEFSGVVDNYHTGLYPTMHWFKDSAGALNYVPQMQAAAESSGAEFRVGTRATQLIIDNGVVAGVYAQDESGAYIQVNAKAVILASGGIGANRELLVQQGWEQSKVDEMMIQCVPSVEGDGYTMAMAVGAKDFLPNSADQSFNAIRAFGFDSTPPYTSPLNASMGPASGGAVLWVNQYADRFNREDIVYINMAAQATACKGNRETYTVFDQAVLDTYTTDPADAEIVAGAFTSENEDSIFKADAIEDLAGHFDLDVETFTKTVERYNGFCRDGRDMDFGKDAQFLKAIETPPFYIAKVISLLVVIDGAIYTNKHAEALDNNLQPIPGLYAVGLDGAMLWRNVYTQNMPGTVMGNNVNSGRNAARSAAAYVGK
jgi:fumarate reductase flavoprotein subunit